MTTTLTKKPVQTDTTKISKFKAYELMKNAGGKIFTVTFIKKGGELRVMNCRTGVKKGLSTNPNKKSIVDTSDQNYLLRVFDCKKGEYRNINLNGMIELKINRKVYTVI